MCSIGYTRKTPRPGIMKSVIGGKGKLAHGLQRDQNFGNGFWAMILLLYSYGAMESVCLPTGQEIPVLTKSHL